MCCGSYRTHLKISRGSTFTYKMKLDQPAVAEHAKRAESHPATVKIEATYPTFISVSDPGQIGLVQDANSALPYQHGYCEV